jgi:hypothetical protein
VATVFLSKEVYIATTTIDYQDCTTTTKPQKKHKQQSSNFQNNTISSLAKLISINRSPFCCWWQHFHQKKSTLQLQPSIIEVAVQHAQRICYNFSTVAMRTRHVLPEAPTRH